MWYQMYKADYCLKHFKLVLMTLYVYVKSKIHTTGFKEDEKRN